MFVAWVTTNLSQRIVGRLVQLPAPVTFILSQLAGCELFDSSLCAGTNPSINRLVIAHPERVADREFSLREFHETTRKTTDCLPRCRSAARDSACEYVTVLIKLS